MDTKPKCFICGSEMRLKKCTKCDSVFCVYCMAPTMLPVRELTNVCLKCASSSIIDLKDTFLNQ
jgi:hypothetical protein